MDRLGIGFLSGFGLPPVEFVDLASDLGCRHISVVVQGQELLPLGYQPFSLKDDALRRDLLAAMNQRRVTITLGDGCLAPRWARSVRISTSWPNSVFHE